MLTDKEFELMKRYRGGVVPVQDDAEVLNELVDKGLLELHHQIWKGKTIPYYTLSFHGLKIFESERSKRSGLYQLLKSICSVKSSS